MFDLSYPHYLPAYAVLLTPSSCGRLAGYSSCLLANCSRIALAIAAIVCCSLAPLLVLVVLLVVMHACKESSFVPATDDAAFHSFGNVLGKILVISILREKYTYTKSPHLAKLSYMKLAERGWGLGFGSSSQA